MQTFNSGQANTVIADLVAKSDGSAITAGTANFYLVALSGDNAGKWFRASDSSWQAAEASAGAAAFKGSSQWQLSIVAAAWTAGVKYSLYAKESGNLNIPYSDIVADQADILLLTGATAGGTWTLAKALKVITARLAGKIRLKSGSTTILEVLDADDETTVIDEVTLSPTTPFRQDNIKI
jgi:hypothetical protein